MFPLSSQLRMGKQMLKNSIRKKQKQQKQQQQKKNSIRDATRENIQYVIEVNKNCNQF